MLDILNKNGIVAGQYDNGFWDPLAETGLIGSSPAPGSVFYDFYAPVGSYSMCLDSASLVQHLADPNDSGGDYAVANAYNPNLFHDWVIESRISFPSDSDATQAYVGVRDYFPTGQRNVRIAFDKTNKRFTYSPISETYTVWITADLQTKDLPDDFDFSDFWVQFTFNNFYVSIVVQEVASGRITSHRFRCDLSVQNTCPVLAWGMGSLGGPVWFTNYGVHSNLSVGLDLIGLFDSIGSGRGLKIESYRFMDRINQKYIDQGVYNFQYADMGSGGLTLAGARRVTQSVINMQPKAVMILLGDNDPILDGGLFNQAWADSYAELVAEYQAAGIFVFVLAMTPDRDDPHDVFSDYLINVLPTVPTLDPARMMVLNTHSLLEIPGDPGRNPDPSYVDSSGTHLSILGNQVMADYIQPFLVSSGVFV